MQQLGGRARSVKRYRYTDYAVLVADKRNKMQKMLERLCETCKA